MKTREAMIAYALAHAADDPDKAEDVLTFFCRDVEMGRQPDDTILFYLAECFRRIIGPDVLDPTYRFAPTDPTEALNLARKQGERSRRTLERVDERDSDAAQAVIRRMDHGDKRDDAITAVATELGSSVSVVKRAYETFAPSLRPNKSDLAKAVIRHMDAGAKRDDAIEAVARERGCSVSIVKRAYEASTRQPPRPKEGKA